jgi:hypothetical protein
MQFESFSISFILYLSEKDANCISFFFYSIQNERIGDFKSKSLSRTHSPSSHCRKNNIVYINMEIVGTSSHDLIDIYLIYIDLVFWNQRKI